MQTHRLTAHLATPPLGVSGVVVRLKALGGGRMLLRWRVDGAERVVLPPEMPPSRSEGLWDKTCFEMFLGDGRGRYREFNFSPSQRWAAFAFASYRQRTGDLPMEQPPEIRSEMGSTVLATAVFVPHQLFDGAVAMGLSAVIEEEGGHKSYWALRHCREKPDFHDPACFAHRFAAAETA